MSSLVRSTTSAKSFQSLRKTTRHAEYKLQNEQDFVTLYQNDPFFREKINIKIEQAHKKMLKNPSLVTTPQTQKDSQCLAFKQKQLISDQQLVEECLFYQSLIEKCNKH